MIPKIEKKFTRLNEKLNTVFNYLDGLTDEQRKQSPKGAWSAVQILRHLQMSESGTASYLRKKVQTNPADVPSAGIAGKLRSFLLSRALKNYGKKFKAPRVIGEMEENPNYVDVKNEYKKTRDELRGLLSGFDQKGAGKAYFKHPVAGKINIHQTLTFLENHFDRHIEQIKERSKV